jgi:hypothetical protein
VLYMHAQCRPARSAQQALQLPQQHPPLSASRYFCSVLATWGLTTWSISPVADMMPY